MKSKAKKGQSASLDGEPINLSGSTIDAEGVRCPLAELRPEGDVVFEDLLAFPRVVFDPKSLKPANGSQSDLSGSGSTPSEEEGSFSSED